MLMPLEMVIHIGGVLKWLSFMLLLWLVLVVAAAGAPLSNAPGAPSKRGGGDELFAINSHPYLISQNTRKV